mmetsp:Transcript_15079/g.58982  ORF Transcript_15079/g.58982 Transcript_15079/m.58982 type:complete len:237 (+) Transcript_15079:928-1638(+)
MRSNATPTLCPPLNAGTFGYRWLKCVNTVRYAPASLPTFTASPTVLCRFLIASSSIPSSNVASCTRTVAPRAASVTFEHGRVSPLYTSFHPSPVSAHVASDSKVNANACAQCTTGVETIRLNPNAAHASLTWLRESPQSKDEEPGLLLNPPTFEEFGAFVVPTTPSPSSSSFPRFHSASRVARQSTNRACSGSTALYALRKRLRSFGPTTVTGSAPEQLDPNSALRRAKIVGNPTW